jgi:hypothetical protein
LWFGCDGDFNVSALLELHLIAMFVSQRILNAEISMPVVGSVNGNLCLFRLAPVAGRG